MASILLSPGSSAGIKASITTEKFSGSDCSGVSGSVNRVLTTSAISTASGDIIVIVDRQTLSLTNDYTISGEDITFLKKIWDQQLIDVSYLV